MKTLAAHLYTSANLSGLRLKVYLYIVGCGGATSEEVEAGLGLRHQTVSARLNELEHRYCLLTTEKLDVRTTSSGRNARVYRERKPKEKAETE